MYNNHAIFIAVSIESPCYGMAATCCFPQKEEEITYTVRMEYNDKLQAAFDKRTQSCKVVGRGFERKLITYPGNINNNCTRN